MSKSDIHLAFDAQHNISVVSLSFAYYQSLIAKVKIPEGINWSPGQDFCCFSGPIKAFRINTHLVGNTCKNFKNPLDEIINNTS